MEGDILDIVQGVFNTPMTANDSHEGFGIGS